MSIKQDKIKEYYKKFKIGLEQNISWKEQKKLRNLYRDVLPFYSEDTLRKGSLLYKEFLRFGLIKDVEDNEQTNKQNNNKVDVKNLPIRKISTSINKDNTVTSERVINLEDKDLSNKEKLLIEHGYDPNEFELISAKNSIWDMNTKTDGVKKLYSSKIVVRPKKVEEKITKEYLNELLEDFHNSYIPYYENEFTKVFAASKNSNLSKCAVISFNDLHWGRYISKELNECSEYTIQSERERILGVMEQAIKRYKTEAIGKLIILLGSDFFNSDCYGFTTLHRNKQDNSMNFKDMFTTGLSLCVDLISMAEKLQIKIDVVFIPGNHGNNEDFVLGKCLQAYYKNAQNIKVHCSAKNRQYIQFHDNLIGFTHGDKEKKSSLANLMAIESDKWSETKNHIWIVGHRHQVGESIVEDNGVVIYNCPSLALNDNYTSEHGYYSKKRVIGFIIDKEIGITEINYFYPDER